MTLKKKTKKSILAFNAGSSSLKCTLFIADNLKEICNIKITNINDDGILLQIKDLSGKVLLQTKEVKNGYEEGFSKIHSLIKEYYSEYEVVGITHRVVHGGYKFLKPTLLTKGIIRELEALTTLAPLHQPYNLKMIEFCMEQYKDIPQVACFDTSFHRTKTNESDLMPIPREFAKKGIIRYGFHGLSYEYIISVIPELTSLGVHKKMIVAHLGNGASMCAIENMESIDTTMSFTPLDGLMMGTRCGDIDPGLVLYLIKDLKMPVDEVYNMLYTKSGLLGVSGISNDIRDLINNSKKEAEEAIGMFAYRAAKQLAGLVAAMGGLDAIIFTGGMGAQSPTIREAICGRLTWLGVHLDIDSNEKNKINIGSRASNVDIYAIPTNEELVMARHCKKLLKL